MGLSNGEILNSMSPGNNGPSDIDHLIHNADNDRLYIYEYKRNADADLPRGQQILFEALRGQWTDGNGRRLNIGWKVLPTEVTGSRATDLYRPGVDWVWPNASTRPTK